MASITGKPNLFFVTSPRTPNKMVEELQLLVTNHGGGKWDKTVQKAFANDLSDADFFEGKLKKDDDFGARDRITRAPKALGLIQLKPTIELTDAGELFVNGKRPHEIFTRQLMKFQLPSPFHVDKKGDFFIKPYLELLRLIYELDGITKSEIAIFFIGCINIDKYEEIKQQIIDYRARKRSYDRSRISYPRFITEEMNRQLLSIYNDQISTGKIKIRENLESADLKKFLRTKGRNHYDYADAAIRYLRNTMLVTLEARTYKVIIPSEKLKEVEFLLHNIKREPLTFKTEKEYQNYLFDASIPTLFTDNKPMLIEEIKHFKHVDKSIDIDSVIASNNIENLKDMRDKLIALKVDEVVNDQVANLQTYNQFGDIQNVYSDILSNNVIDRPLFFEWNTWRGFTMLDDGNITGNFRVDDNGMPLSTASGNQPDILCEYDDFDMLVEVTLSSGARQYEMEGEPVARHVGSQQKSSGRETYCIFIAPNLNPATIAHFYLLHKSKIAYYGGNTKIIPMSLEDYQEMLRVAYEAKEKPTSNNLKNFLEKHSNNAIQLEDEEQWYQQIKNSIPYWLDINNNALGEITH